jgi:2-polyprenyl-3-methyl-5-hydroxy-6-metoxy-1,4-benzoquinol methylase
VIRSLYTNYLMNRDDYQTPIVDKYITALQEYFNLSYDEVTKRGSVEDCNVFDSYFTPQVLENNDPNEINAIYASTPFFAFRNPIYYANREVEAHRMYLTIILEKPGSILDHGSGAGVLIEVLLRHGLKDITYTDVPGPTFEFARWFFGDKIKYEEDPAHLKGKYDYITSNSVLEHLPDPVKTVKMFGRHLNKGGKIIASMAQDIHGQHLKKAIDRYDEVMSLIDKINAK